MPIMCSCGGEIREGEERGQCPECHALSHHECTFKYRPDGFQYDFYCENCRYRTAGPRCARCNTLLSETDDLYQCARCKQPYHYDCAWKLDEQRDDWAFSCKKCAHSEVRPKPRPRGCAPLVLILLCSALVASMFVLCACRPVCKLHGYTLSERVARPGG